MGLKSTQCWFEVERTLWSLNSGEASCACEEHVGGLASRKTAELKKIVPPESLEHVSQRKWWLYKVWAPSKIIISHGAKSRQCWPEVERTLWSLNSEEASCACEQHVGGRCKSEKSKPKKMVSVESLEHVHQRRWWLYKVWAPSKIIIFDGAQIDAVLIWGRKNAMEPKFWWGVLCMRRTGRRLLQIGKQQKQRRWCL